MNEFIILLRPYPYMLNNPPALFNIANICVICVISVQKSQCACVWVCLSRHSYGLSDGGWLKHLFLKRRSAILLRHRRYPALCAMCPAP
jgi:hypothetical protein